MVVARFVNGFLIWIFFKVKFITKPSKLEYADPIRFPKTFCAVIIKGCNLPPEMDPERWWNSFGKMRTKEIVTKIRNDKITGLKWEFFGKWGGFLNCYISWFILSILKAFCKSLMKEEGGSERLNELHSFFYTRSMRSDPDIYKDFFNIFVRQIVGRREFDANCAQWVEGCSENDIASVSDEALALLCFENQFEVWQDVWQKSKGKICPISRKDEYPQDWITTKFTKYTTKRDEKGMPIDTKDKSWTNKGFERFNELFKKVMKDRRDNPTFMSTFMTWKRENSKKMIGNDEGSKQEPPDVSDTLFYNPDEWNQESFTPEPNNDLPKQSEQQNQGKGKSKRRLKMND